MRRQSTIDRPDSVNLVTPPKTTAPKLENYSLFKKTDIILQLKILISNLQPFLNNRQAINQFFY